MDKYSVGKESYAEVVSGTGKYIFPVSVLFGVWCWLPTKEFQLNSTRMIYSI